MVASAVAIAICLYEGAGAAATLTAAAILVLGGIVWVIDRLRKEKVARSLLGPKCSNLDFVGYTHNPTDKIDGGIGPKEHCFNFANREFAQKFAELNGRSIMTEKEVRSAVNQLGGGVNRLPRLGMNW
jgi:hypothetical protein